MKPRDYFLLLLWVFALSSAATLIAVVIDATHVKKPNLIRLDHNPKTCFQYRPIKFCGPKDEIK